MMHSKRSEKKLEFEAIGTLWIIDFVSEKSTSSIEGQVKRCINTFDKVYSRFRPDSDIMQLSKNAGSIKLPSDADEMMDLYQKLYSLTNGLFTPLIGNLLDDAGYDKKYSFKVRKLHSPPLLEKVLSFKNSKLTLNEPAILDFGALGKGKLIDLVAGVLEENDVGTYTIDAGGDIFHKGNTIRVGLEHPEDKTMVIGIAEIKNQSICSSSGNRRAWGRFHHIINPETLSPVDKIISTWVVAETAMLADGLATCLFFTTANNLKSEFDFEYAIIDSGMTMSKSTNFPAKMFTER